LPNGQVSIHVSNVAEAKLALSELRTKKKELALAKRAAIQEQRQIRAGYTSAVRQRGSKFVGGGSIGRIARGLQTASRDATRRQLANALAPLEDRRSGIDARILALDAAIVQLQRYIQ